MIWGSPVTDDEPAYDILLASPKVITFRTFANCVGAVRACFDYHEFVARYRSPFANPVAACVDRSAVASICLAGTTLIEHESKEVLAAYGIPVTPRRS